MLREAQPESPIASAQEADAVLARQGLSQALHVLRATLDAVDAHLCVLDAHGAVILLNLAWHTRPLASHCPLHELALDQDYLDQCRKAAQQGLAIGHDIASSLERLLRGSATHWECEYSFSAGERQRWYRLRAQTCSQGLARIILTHQDISAQKDWEQQSRLSRLLYEYSGEAMMLSDASNNILAINPAFTRVTGYSAEQVVGKNPRLLSSGRQDGEFYRRMWQSLHETGVWQGEIWNRRADGREYAEWLTIRVLRDREGQPQQYMAMFSDITEKKQSRQLLWRQANYDAVTGLPNRQLFLDRLTLEIRKAMRASESMALFMIDLDHFKDVNDALGHSRGDQLLTAVAHRIGAAVRESDTVARVGGDEFTVILAGISGVAVLDRVAGHILDALSQPFALDGETIFVSASIGIAVCPNDAWDGESLLHDAEQALYAAKSEGRACARYFRARNQEESLAKLRLVADLKQALALGQFQLEFQPIVNLRDGSVDKAEALLRWKHPLRGQVSPAEFIPAAEDAGLIGDMSDWALKQAIRWAGQWSRLLGRPFQVTVNRSPSELNQAGWQHQWLQIMADQEVHPSCLVLEITEGVLLEESPVVKAGLDQLRRAGVHVAIDDFGTGYSSMAYLNRFQADFLKIDRSFISDMASNESHRAVVEAIIVMAQRLGMQLVAEGVEDETQRALLQSAGCHFGQGFLFSRALPPEEFQAAFLNHRSNLLSTKEGD